MTLKGPLETCEGCEPLHQIMYRNGVLLCGALDLNRTDIPHDVIKVCVYNPNKDKDTLHEQNFHIEEACVLSALLTELVAKYLEEFNLEELHKNRRGQSEN